MDEILKHFLWTYSLVNATATEHIWWSFNISSGNGLVPNGTKPLPEPMLTQFYVTTWHH